MWIVVVIINEADALTRDAQAALRRTMEKYMNNMRLILCANSTSKIIAPIRSRCLLVRVSAPDEQEVSPSGQQIVYVGAKRHLIDDKSLTSRRKEGTFPSTRFGLFEYHHHFRREHAESITGFRSYEDATTRSHR